MVQTTEYGTNLLTLTYSTTTATDTIQLKCTIPSTIYLVSQYSHIHRPQSSFCFGINIKFGFFPLFMPKIKKYELYPITVAAFAVIVNNFGIFCFGFVFN